MEDKLKIFFTKWKMNSILKKFKMTSIFTKIEEERGSQLNLNLLSKEIIQFPQLPRGGGAHLNDQFLKGNYTYRESYKRASL